MTAGPMAAGLLAAIWTVACPPEARAESLKDAIALAYQTNPTLLNQRSQLRVTDETYVQAKAGFRPQVTVEVDAERQDYQGATGNSGDALLTATQPIYTGGRTATAVSAAEADILSGRETLRATEATVLEQVVQAYADVIRDQEGLAIHQANRDALADQVKEVRARQTAGDLTRTDVAQTEGYYYQTLVDLASAKAQLETSQAEYAATVGKRPDTLEPLPALPKMPESINQALETAEAGNPSLRSSQYAEESARLRTAEARDQRLPTATLKFQYGYTGPASTFLPNVYPREVTGLLTVTQPLFAGGTIDSQIRTQIEKQTAARIQTEQSRRVMVQQISQAWSTYLAARESVVSADNEVQANQIAYEGMQKERRADLRSTLEVLYIEQSLRASELARSAAKHDQYVAGAQLLQMMGFLEARFLTPGINVYDPAKSFQKVKNAGWVPWEYVPEAFDKVTAPGLHKLAPPPDEPIKTSP